MEQKGTGKKRNENGKMKGEFLKKRQEFVIHHRA